MKVLKCSFLLSWQQTCRALKIQIHIGIKFYLIPSPVSPEQCGLVPLKISQNPSRHQSSTPHCLLQQSESSRGIVHLTNQAGGQMDNLNDVVLDKVSLLSVFFFRWKGGGDKGEPETLHHGAWEGVWRAGYSLQLHQDSYCQE